MTADLIVCATCRHSAEDRDDPAGVRGGQRLYEAIAAAAGDPRYAAVNISQVECLWACTEHCTVHLRSPGKVSYVAGRFSPDGAEAEAILEFASAYAASTDGAVPYKTWPQGVKGHFITRSPA
jgi:predicted metal-binding protein